jgi:hypothetical protein
MATNAKVRFVPEPDMRRGGGAHSHGCSSAGLTFGGARTNMLQGVAHLALFIVFVA